MQNASGDAVVIMDGELQDPPELIEDFFNKWKDGYDIVFGNRVKRETSFFLNLSYKLFYRLFNKLSYIKIPLDAGDFSLMDRKVINEINQFPENDRFIRGLRAWVGFKQIGVPYLRQKRILGNFYIGSVNESPVPGCSTAFSIKSAKRSALEAC